MALLQCFECKNPVSSTAAACPSCGAPVQQQAPTVAAAAPQRTMGFWMIIGVLFMPYIFAWFLLRKGYPRTARVIGFSWMVVCLLGLMVNKVPHTKSPDFDPVAAAQQRAQLKAEQEAREIEALPLYNASDLARAYADNTIAADQEFKGQRFKVTGTVVAINTDFLGKPFVSLKGGVNQFMEPQFGFDKDQLDDLADLRKGMRVTFVCIGRGDVAKTPMSGSCTLL